MEFFIEIIEEKDFIPIVNKASTNMLNFTSCFSKSETIKLSKKHYVAIVKESMELEDFLDDHGARNNKVWIHFGEIVACIRNVSSTAYIISHILRRIKFYKLNSKNVANFIKEANTRLDFLNESISSLFLHLKKEALNLGLNIPSGNIDMDEMEEDIIIKTLPQNINDEGVKDIYENVSRIAWEFINMHNDSSNVMFEKKVPLQNLVNKLIPDKINEETLRCLETHVHNAQSMYDTYIRKTPIESENKVLGILRGHISITLHLLSIARELTHFYERHETSVRNEATRRKISKIIQHKEILDNIVNFALYYFTCFIQDGLIIAKEILDKFTVVESKVMKVPEGLGFHLRPSTLVAKIANHYGSKVTMVVNNKEFDASSIIDIMWAGGMIKKDSITEIEFRGDKSAVSDLKLLADVNYGEDTMGNSTPLPDELSYLRQG
jgi:phosphotransferase system HPr (HPr) family protein